MTRTIVNLAASVVVAEVQSILKTYPAHPHREAFSAPSLRQKLLVYVLSRMPNCYVVVDDHDLHRSHPETIHCPLDQRRQMVALIHQGIEHLLQEDRDFGDRPLEENPTLTPSHWFG